MKAEAEPVQMPIGSRVRKFLHEWALACVVSALILPNTIAIVTVALYVTGPPHFAHDHDPLNRTRARCVIFGVALALAFCVLLAGIALRRFTRAGEACPDVFAELRREYVHVRARLEADRVATAPDRESVCNEVKEYCNQLDDDLARPSQAGIPWLLASGYLTNWRRLHAADEKLMLVDPPALVVAGALGDEMRLQGSLIPQSSVLQTRLRRALGHISTTGPSYFIEPPPPSSGAACPPPAYDQATKDEAVAVLATVRAAIDAFRDSSREGLVRSRNRLYALVLVEGVTGCVLLGLGILTHASQRSIAAVAVFFLVGGIVGLFRQLQMAAGENIEQDDYGLGIIRLFQTPLVSGIAGVGGVVLVKLSQGIPTNQLNHFLQHTLVMNPYALVTAAAFGLTPSLFLSGLQQRADKYKSDLASSGASQSSQASPQ